MANIRLGTGETFRFVDRDQLRRKTPGLSMSIPRHLLGIAKALPKAPDTFDWSKNGEISFPTYGNDRWGNCYYCAIAHHSQAFTGNASPPQCEFDTAKIVSRYLKLSNGDNGLTDSVTMNEWKGGIVGPSGPRKIITQMSVNPRDYESVRLAAWAFCGLIYTAALPNYWINNARPGMVWDIGTPNQSNGHAMYISSIDPNLYFIVQTWGFSPAIKLTYNGLLSSDPELFVAFSLDMFNSKGISPSGMTYDEAALLWQQVGGGSLPPSPFPKPVPVPPTPPPVPVPPTPPPVPPTPPPVPVPTPPTPPPAPVAVTGLTLAQTLAVVDKAIESGRPYGPMNVAANVKRRISNALNAAWPKK